MELTEKVYRLHSYEIDDDGTETTNCLGYYLIKYVEIIRERFACLVWLPEAREFASIDVNHDIVYILEKKSWDDILQKFDYCCDPDMFDKNFEFFDHHFQFVPSE